MKKLLFLLLGIFSFSISFAQKQNDHWIIGNKLAKFKYNSTSNFDIILPNLSKNFDKSPAIISDKTTGDLLFYSDGETIWNNTRAIMDNGSGINGTSTLAQAVIIVPNPINSMQYYLFTLKADNYNNNSLYYSIIDMSLNSGSGSVISKNNLLLSNIDNEKLASTFGHDKSYFWIIVRKGKDYYSYKLNSFGIQNPVISTTSLSSSNELARKQKLKISPDSKYVASTIHDERNNSVAKCSLNASSYASYYIHLLKFNNTSGVLTEHNIDNSDKYYFQVDYTLDNNQNISYDFSSDSKYFVFKTITSLLCGSYRLYINVFNLENNNINGVNNIDNSWLNTDIQLGADNNLYLINNNFSGSAGLFYKLISNDNYTNTHQVKGTLNNYPITVGLLNGGLPQLVHSPENVCQQNLVIDQPILSSHVYTASNSITASSIINENLTVDYNARQVVLKPGFKTSKTNFNAKVNPCTKLSISNQNNRITSVSETITNSKNTFTISPNPTSNFVQINSTVGIKEWFVYDINAKIVVSGNNKNATALKVNLQTLPAGLYYFKFIDDLGTINEKTIIKK